MRLCMIGVRGHNGYVLAGLPQTTVKVVGVCTAAQGDDIGGLMTQCQDLGHDPQIYDEPTRMLDDLAPDVVSISGPIERHAELCVQAFRRGSHVFCEKPVALTLEELDQVTAEHQRAGVHFAAMMGLRYDPAFYTAWQAVRDGSIGEVRLLNTQKSYRLGRRASYYHRRATSGGTIPWVGSHAIDWIHWFAGKPFASLRSANHLMRVRSTP